MLLNLSDSISHVENCLRSLGWLQEHERVLRLGKPGEGNMNVVIRVMTDQRSIILKQSRPYVAKYTQVPAPLDRILTEHAYNQAIADDPVLTARSPKFLAFSAEHHLVMMEDLGNTRDMTYLYQESEVMEAPLLEQAISYLVSLHSIKPSTHYPDNIELRQLNHQHIFVIPFTADNDIALDDITPGLDAISRSILQDEDLLEIVSSLGDLYLSTDGDTLLHGDYYPGSWLLGGDQLYIIDAEFSFLGFPEFDLGVMGAHLFMSSGRKEIIAEIIDIYTDSRINNNLVHQIAGVEVIRRLLGLAQLPLTRTIQQKSSLLHAAVKLIKNA